MYWTQGWWPNSLALLVGRRAVRDIGGPSVRGRQGDHRQDVAGSPALTARGPPRSGRRTIGCAPVR